MRDAVLARMLGKCDKKLLNTYKASWMYAALSNLGLVQISFSTKRLYDEFSKAQVGTSV